MSYCIVIPCYQHSSHLRKILAFLQKYELETIVVNDGSDDFHSQNIEEVCNDYSNVFLITHQSNQGKGASVISALDYAKHRGFTHAIQIDSDGQHNLEKISDLISLSNAHPTAVISGFPIFDDNAPLGRKIGRWLTHIWVWIETLSTSIKDSMCGFRIYPVDKTLAIAQKSKIGLRMEFDIEILVRLYWAGIETIQLPVEVTYPENGYSNFRLLRDNCLITKMHTKLVIEKIFSFLFFGWRSEAKPWHKIPERGAIIGIKILLGVKSVLGQKISKIFLYPISIYYYLFSPSSKRNFSIFKSHVIQERNRRRIPPSKISFYENLLEFANAIFLKFSVWQNNIELKMIRPSDLERFRSISRSELGAVFLSSHFGNLEIIRAIGVDKGVRKFTALVYNDNAKKFNEFLKKVNPKFGMDMMSLKNFGLGKSSALKSKVDDGDWLFIMGDRNSISGNQKYLKGKFLGEDVTIGAGPFVLAYLMDVPIYSVFVFSDGHELRIETSAIEYPEHAKTREDKIQYIFNTYLSCLEEVTLTYPNQWFNFFNFWESHESS